MSGSESDCEQLDGVCFVGLHSSRVIAGVCATAALSLLRERNRRQKATMNTRGLQSGPDRAHATDDGYGGRRMGGPIMYKRPKKELEPDRPIASCACSGQDREEEENSGLSRARPYSLGPICDHPVVFP